MNLTALSPELADKHARAAAILRPLERVAVAFSAGVDSTLVLKLAVDTLGAEHVVAVTGRSDSLAQAELEEACRIAGLVGVEHVILDTDELADPRYAANPVNRCYFCKTTLYRHMDRLLAERNLHAMVNGTNQDDLGDHRPGLSAAGEHNVRAPLAEAGLTKADVRALAARLGLPNHDKPATPCLSSRIPYGEPVTPEKLRRIEDAERFLKDTLALRDCRVRHAGTTARIEVPPDDFATLLVPETAIRIDHHLRSLGFTCVTLDLRGLRSGSLNEAITLRVAPA